MSDREWDDIRMLESAARAAGLPWDQWVIDGDDSWNPLTDDGDALRLFCTLPWLCVETSDVGVTVRERGEAGARVYLMWTEWLEDHGGSTSAALRRAIVRAAAAMAPIAPDADGGEA